jgi:hypothetical protein
MEAFANHFLSTSVSSFPVHISSIPTSTLSSLVHVQSVSDSDVIQDSLQVLHIVLIWPKIKYASIACSNLTLTDSIKHETTYIPKNFYVSVVSVSFSVLAYMT